MISRPSLGQRGVGGPLRSSQQASCALRSTAERLLLRSTLRSARTSWSCRPSPRTVTAGPRTFSASRPEVPALDRASRLPRLDRIHCGIPMTRPWGPFGIWQFRDRRALRNQRASAHNRYEEGFVATQSRCSNPASRQPDRPD